MFSYVQPGMKFGLQPVENTGSFELLVYTDDNYVIAQDISRLGQSGNAKKAAESNPLIQKQLDAFVSQLDSSRASTDRIMIIPLFRVTFGTLVEVGDDYLLFSIQEDASDQLDMNSKRRRIIPRSSISSIDLDANPVRFIDGNSLFKNQRGR